LFTSRLIEARALRVRPTSDRRAGREAITRYRVVARRREGALVELRLVTGRRGQIRTQLAAAGHPIAGDREYGARTDPMRRLALHATRLGFAHPGGGRVVFESLPPPAFGRGSAGGAVLSSGWREDMGNPERLVGAEVANLAAAIERAAADLAMAEEPAGFTVALEGVDVRAAGRRGAGAPPAEARLWIEDESGERRD